MEDRTSEHPLPDRRTVLAGASAAALGVSALMLPTAAAAVSPGGQGGAGVFGQIGADITVTTTGIASDANVRRSFTHGGKRYFLDRTNYQLFQFNSAGTFEQLVTIANPPTGGTRQNPSQFLVHGNAAYIAMTRSLDVDGTPKPHLSVLRLDLSSPLGTSVTATYWDLDLNAKGVWGTRTIGGVDYSGVSMDLEHVSALTVDSAGVLHCVMNNRSNPAGAFFIDYFDIPANFGTVPDPVNLYASTTSWPVRASRANAITVGSYSIFFHDSQGSYPLPAPALRVPHAAPGDWSLLPITRPSGYSSLDFFNIEDRSMVVVGGALWANVDYFVDHTVSGADTGAAAVRLDIGAASVTAATDPSLPITTVIPIPDSKWSSYAIATDGSNLYLGFDKTSGDSAVARFVGAGAGTASFDASVPAAFASTMQGTENGVLVATAFTREFILLGDVVPD